MENSLEEIRLDRIISELKKLSLYKGDNDLFQQIYKILQKKPYGEGSLGSISRGIVN
jgi:hypothetical protein